MSLGQALTAAIEGLSVTQVVTPQGKPFEVAVGDMNLTFKSYLTSRIDFTVENDFVTAIKGDGLDAELLRDYMEAWEDPLAYGFSHVGWGMNPAARWVSHPGRRRHGGCRPRSSRARGPWSASARRSPRRRSARLPALRPAHR